MVLVQGNLPLLSRYLMTVFVCCTIASATWGQSKSMALNYSAVAKTGIAPTIRPLSIGDQVPDIVFENVLNYKSKKARLSDFKGKLVILDMWSTWCTSCIAAFPKMEQLQEQYSDQLQILLVNHYYKLDPEERIKTILAKQKQRTGYYPSLPIPIHDTVLNQYFPHESVPHQVWIDGDGKVVAITGSVDVTSKNIQAILEGRNILIPVKNDWAFDSKKPLLIDGNGGNNNDFIYRSIFTPYKGGIGYNSGIRINSDNKITGAYILNSSLRDLVSAAYSDVLHSFGKNRILLNVKDSSKWGNSFDPRYAYCYDLTIPPMSSDQFEVRDYIQEDLKRVFNISVKVETRRVRSLVFRSTNRVKNLITKHNKRDADLESQSLRKFFHNYTITNIIKRLDDYFDLPLIDETGIIQNIDMDFPIHFDLSNTTTLIHFIEQLGFKITEESKEMEVVVIAEK